MCCQDLPLPLTVTNLIRGDSGPLESRGVGTCLPTAGL